MKELGKGRRRENDEQAKGKPIRKWQRCAGKESHAISRSCPARSLSLSLSACPSVVFTVHRGPRSEYRDEKEEDEKKTASAVSLALHAENTRERD